MAFFRGATRGVVVPGVEAAFVSRAIVNQRTSATPAGSIGLLAVISQLAQVCCVPLSVVSVAIAEEDVNLIRMGSELTYRAHESLQLSA